MKNSDILKSIWSDIPFTKDEADLVYSSFELIKVEKGHKLISQGTIPKEYYYVNTGFFRTYVVNDKGDDITTGFYTQGNLMQDLPSLFLKTATQENIEALANSSVWKITHENSEKLFHSIETFRKAGRARLVKGYYILKKRHLDFVSKTAQERYLELIEQYPEIIKQAHLKHIASFLGITDSSLSRIRKEITR